MREAHGAGSENIYLGCMTVRKIIAQKPGEREGCQEGEHSQPCRSGTLRQYSGVVGTDAACSLVSLRDAVGSISALGATAEALWPRARPSGEGSTFFAPACESRREATRCLSMAHPAPQS